MRILSNAALVLTMMETYAFAYMDAGTGSMLLQVLLGMIASVVVTAKLYWGKVTSFFKKKKD